MKLETKGISYGYKKGKTILKNLSLYVETGEIVCILGPNGTGKTTMLRLILGFNKPQEGEVFLDGKPMNKLTPKQRAKHLAYVPQYSYISFPYAAKEVVLMGRTSYVSYGKSFSKEDYKKAEDAMEMLGILDINDSLYNELSGGQKQMILLARAIVQDSQIIIMDEPTANLDYSNQLKMLATIKSLSKKGYGILMTSHFPDHAFLTDSRVILMQDGRKLYDGRADDVVTTKTLTELYKTDVEVSKARSICLNKDVKVCIPILK